VRLRAPAAPVAGLEGDAWMEMRMESSVMDDRPLGWRHRILGLLAIVVFCAFLAGVFRILYSVVEWLFGVLS
jgi:hypothetical protein